MAVVAEGASGAFDRCDMAITYAFFLIIERGNRYEATASAKNAAMAVAAALDSSPGKVNKSQERSWHSAAEILGLRSWSWFVVTAVWAVVTLLLPTQHSFGVTAAAEGAVSAVPSALFATRQVALQAVIRVLRTHSLTSARLKFLNRSLGSLCTAAAALFFWVSWTILLSCQS